MFMLILFAYAGALANGDSVAFTNVGSFQNESACIVAGDKASKMSAGTTKVIKYTCIKV